MKIQCRSIAAEGFDWDDGNLLKAQKHGLSLKQIEKFFQQELLIVPDYKNSDVEDRYVAFSAEVTGRAMIAIFTMRELRGATLIRVISARYMHKKEILIYEKIKENI